MLFNEELFTAESKSGGNDVAIARIVYRAAQILEAVNLLFEEQWQCIITFNGDLAKAVNIKMIVSFAGSKK